MSRPLTPLRPEPPPPGWTLPGCGRFNFGCLVAPALLCSAQLFAIHRYNLSRPYLWSTPVTSLFGGSMLNWLFGVRMWGYVVPKGDPRVEQIDFVAAAQGMLEALNRLPKQETTDIPVIIAERLWEAMKMGDVEQFAQQLFHWDALCYLDLNDLPEEMREVKRRLQELAPKGVYLAPQEIAKTNRDVALRVVEIIGGVKEDRTEPLEGPISALYGRAKTEQGLEYQLRVLKYWQQRKGEIEGFNVVLAAQGILGRYAATFL